MLHSLVLLAACLVLNLSSGSFVSAQTDSCSRRTLSVYVEDSQRTPITELVPADFEARVHGKPIKVLSVERDARPHRIVLIIDTSRSMYSMAPGEPPWWGWEFALARHFFDQNSQKAQIALLMFSKRVNEVVDFSQGNSVVDNRLQQAAKGYGYLRRNRKGPTTLHEVILQGLQLIDQPRSADAIYVLTDAGDYIEATQGAHEVIQRLVATQVRLFAVLLQRESGGVRKVAEEVLGPEELSQIARKSGGAILSTAEWHGDRVSLSANPDGKATETLTRLYQAILQNSVLEIELPFPIEKNERLELRLSSEARRQSNAAQIIYSDNLIGCGSTSSRN